MATVSPEVAVTVLDFISYAMFAAGAMAVYFGFRFLFYESDEDKSSREAAGDELRGRISTGIKDSRERKKIEEGVSKRKHLLEPAKGFLIRAMQHCDHGREQFDVQSDVALRRGRDHVQQVHHNLNSARRVMKTAWHSAKGEQREDLRHLTAAVEALRNTVHTEVIGKIPRDHTDSRWGAMTSQIRGHLEKFEPRIAAIIQSIDNCIDADKRIPEYTTESDDSSSGGSGAGGATGRTGGTRPKRPGPSPASP